MCTLYSLFVNIVGNNHLSRMIIKLIDTIQNSKYTNYTR